MSTESPGGGSKMAGALIVHPLYQHTVHAEPEPIPFWEAVSDDVLHRVASLVGCGQTLANLRLVCRRCKRIADSDDLWRQLCVARFSIAPDSRPPKSWAEVYRFNMAVFQVLLQQADALVMHNARRAVRAHLPGNFAAMA